jgi:hypothetical protein
MFLKQETINNHFEISGKSEVQDRYRPGAAPFTLPFVRASKGDVEIIDGGFDDEYVQGLLTESDQWIRFPIHPESFELYAPLIEKHGLESGPIVQATASTRSLILTEHGVGVKASIAKRQFGLGRVVPDWEIRRSVMISKVAARTPQEEWFKYGVSIIPDVMGVYVKPHLMLKASIDDKQPLVVQHGVLYRDLDFLNQLPQFPKYPLFSLFSSEQNKEPLLIQKWRASGLSFYDYVEEAILKPIVRSTAYLVFYQGFVPEMHGQNIVVAIDPSNGQIKHVFHRDTGSMKVDLRQRLARGLPVEDFKSFDTQSDFKFLRATSLAGTPIYGWFYSYMFTDFRHMERELKKYVHDYEPERIKERIDKLVERELNRYFPETGQTYRHSIREADVARRVETSFVSKKPMIEVINSKFSEGEVLRFLSHQVRYKQVLPFPKNWYHLADGKWAATKFGILFGGSIFGLRDGVFLAPYTNEKNPISTADHPQHYTTPATPASIYFDKTHQYDAVGVAEFMMQIRKVKKVIPLPQVIRLKVNGENVYQLISGEQYALYQYLIEKRTQIDVEVVIDLSKIDETKQLELLNNSRPFTQNSAAKTELPDAAKESSWTHSLKASCSWLLHSSGL